MQLKDKVLNVLQAGTVLSATEIYRKTNANLYGGNLKVVLQELLAGGKIATEASSKSGRPVTGYKLVPGTEVPALNRSYVSRQDTDCALKVLREFFTGPAYGAGKPGAPYGIPLNKLPEICLGVEVGKAVAILVEDGFLELYERDGQQFVRVAAEPKQQESDEAKEQSEESELLSFIQNHPGVERWKIKRTFRNAQSSLLDKLSHDGRIVATPSTHKGRGRSGIVYSVATTISAIAA